MLAHTCPLIVKPANSSEAVLRAWWASEYRTKALAQWSLPLRLFSSQSDRARSSQRSQEPRTSTSSVATSSSVASPPPRLHLQRQSKPYLLARLPGTMASATAGSASCRDPLASASAPSSAPRTVGLAPSTVCLVPFRHVSLLPDSLDSPGAPFRSNSSMVRFRLP